MSGVFKQGCVKRKMDHSTAGVWISVLCVCAAVESLWSALSRVRSEVAQLQSLPGTAWTTMYVLQRLSPTESNSCSIRWPVFWPITAHRSTFLVVAEERSVFRCREQNNVKSALTLQQVLSSENKMLTLPLIAVLFLHTHALKKSICEKVHVHCRAETNTSSTRLPGSSKYPNYPIAGIRIR